MTNHHRSSSLPKNIHGGIFLLEDKSGPGSGAKDYTKPNAPHPKVGKIYIFRAWIDENNDGVWDHNEREAMNQIKRIQWKLQRDLSVTENSPASFNSEEITIAGATTDQYKIPIQNYSESVKLHQGFNLMVEFE